MVQVTKMTNESNSFEDPNASDYIHYGMAADASWTAPRCKAHVTNPYAALFAPAMLATVRIELLERFETAPMPPFPCAVLITCHAR
jgi:hypothetical protein